MSSYFHRVFNTKERQHLITPELRERLSPCIGGTSGNNGMKALTVGAVEDHVHILLSMPATLSISKAMQLIKGASSR